MSSGVRVGVCVWTIAIVAALAGCTVVDQYSGRAIVYNLEAEQAQDQAMLLNIVRAYLRRPMQFTTVSTITGTALATGSVQYTLPTNVPFRPATQGATGIAAFPPLPTWLFGGSMSGGPAFTVPVLDTQEFYQGILKAIPGQIWDLYLQANYPPDLLINLFVQRIVVRHKGTICRPDDHTSRCEFTFYNYVGSNIEIKLFQKFTDYLLWLGLTTEAPAAKTVPFDQPTNVNIRYVGAPGKPDNNNIPTAEVVAPPGGAASGEASAAPKAYKLCFAPRFARSIKMPRSREHWPLVESSSLCGHGAVEEQALAKRLSELQKLDKRKLREQQLSEQLGQLKLRQQQLSEQPDQRGAAAGLLRELQSRIRQSTEQLSREQLLIQRLTDRLSREQSSEQSHQAIVDSGADTAKSTITTSGLATVSAFANEDFIKKLKEIARRYDGCPNMAGQRELAARNHCRDVGGQLEDYFNNGTDMELTIYMRNTEGMIYYLGEVVRRGLNPDLERNDPRPTFVKRGSPYDEYPWEKDCEQPGVLIVGTSTTCNYVFRLIEGEAPASGDMVSIQYGGHWYSVIGRYDPEKPDLSTLTLEFVKQQIALNSSAKSLPQSSVITTVGQ